MAGYDEDFWGEDFFEEEEGATEGEETEVETEETADTEGTEGTEGAEVDIDGEDAAAKAERARTRASAPTFWHALRRRRRKEWTHALRGNLRGF